MKKILIFSLLLASALFINSQDIEKEKLIIKYTVKEIIHKTEIPYDDKDYKDFDKKIKNIVDSGEKITAPLVFSKTYPIKSDNDKDKISEKIEIAFSPLENNLISVKIYISMIIKEFNIINTSDEFSIKLIDSEIKCNFINAIFDPADKKARKNKMELLGTLNYSGSVTNKCDINLYYNSGDGEFSVQSENLTGKIKIKNIEYDFDLN